MSFGVCGLSCLVTCGIFLPRPGIEPIELMSPVLAGGFFTPGPPGKSQQRGNILRLVGRNQSKSKAWGCPPGSSHFNWVSYSSYLPQERGPWPFVVGEGFFSSLRAFPLLWWGCSYWHQAGGWNGHVSTWWHKLGGSVLATGVCVKVDPWQFPEGNLELGHRFPPQPTPVEMGWPSFQEQVFWASLVKSLPASAGDTGSIPDPGRSHVPWATKPGAPQLLRLHALDLVLRNKRTHHNEKPMHHE